MEIEESDSRDDHWPAWDYYIVYTRIITAIIIIKAFRVTLQPPTKSLTKFTRHTHSPVGRLLFVQYIFAVQFHFTNKLYFSKNFLRLFLFFYD